eukprot:5395919-Pleurochrysis_carterae.AAC.1
MQAVLGPKELEIELERYLYLEDSRDEPMLKVRDPAHKRKFVREGPFASTRDRLRSCRISFCCADVRACICVLARGCMQARAEASAVVHGTRSLKKRKMI